MIFTVDANGILQFGDRSVRCALGPAGVIPAAAKREGDGATPAGSWPLRRVIWREDRGPRPATALPVRALAHDDGWCDDPADAAYNRLVRLPYPASAERLWREDSIYDLIVVLGYNDDPPVAGGGSAIFLHIARPDFAATQGCVAVERQYLEILLALASPGHRLDIRLPDRGQPKAQASARGLRR